MNTPRFLGLKNCQIHPPLNHPPTHPIWNNAQENWRFHLAWWLLLVQETWAMKHTLLLYDLYIGDFTYVGIIINHYKDPHKSTDVLSTPLLAVPQKKYIPWSLYNPIYRGYNKPMQGSLLSNKFSWKVEGWKTCGGYRQGNSTGQWDLLVKDTQHEWLNVLNYSRWISKLGKHATLLVYILN